MLKNIQVKILLSFLVLGIVMASLIGATLYSNLYLIENELMVTSDANTLIEIEKIVLSGKTNIIYTAIIMIIAFGIVGFVVAIIVTSPIRKIVKNAEEYAKADKGKVKYLSDGKKKSEFDSLVATFTDMNVELKENLNEVTRQ